MSVGERIQSVQRFTAAMLQKREEIVTLLQWEIGKSLQEAEREFDRTVAYIRDTLEALKELDRASSRFVIQQGIIGQIRRAPLGVVLCMGPYNFPLYETFTTLIPALVMGNTILLKPPRFGILIFQPLLAAFRDSFPAGVVNTVYGDGEISRSPADGLRPGGCARIYRNPPGCRCAACGSSPSSSSPLCAWAGCQESGRHPAGCRP